MPTALCDSVKAVRAFTIMAVIICGAGVALAVMKRRPFAAAAFAVCGEFPNGFGP